MAEFILPFTEFFAHAQQAELAGIEPPPELIDVWIHVILALATFSQDRRRSRQLMRQAVVGLEQGLQTIIDARAREIQLEHVPALPLDLVSLMTWRLLHDVTGDFPNIYETYSSYLLSIVSFFTFSVYEG